MTDDEQKKIFSKNLSYYVSLSGKQQKEIADELNYNQKTFNGWCTGLSMPKAGKIQTLADYFHIDKSDLTDKKNLTKLRSKEYERILDVCNMNYKGVLHWSEDMKTEDIHVILSDDIRRDAMTKFSYVSPAGTAGLFCNAVAGDFQKEGEAREVFKALIREIVDLSHAMGIQFQEDLVERNLKILSDLPPETTTSMQRDVLALRHSEMDGLVFEVVRMGKKYGVSMPQYEKAAEYFRENLKQ